MEFEVRKWLEAGGFGSYADLFEANGIDAEALRALTDEHLRELAIPIGPRVKLLKAIRDLSARPVADSSAAERRQLTLMFVDLVGSTALSGRLDPEDLRELIRTYQNLVAGEVARYGGHVAQYLGDGVLAYFGYPSAHEDDAERAVRAALSLLSALQESPSRGSERLSARVGIATGIVVVGDLLGEGGAREHGVVGETPNLAARLQSVAAPGQAVVSARTRALVGPVFEFRDLGPQHLRGVSVPVLAYAVVGERAVETRFEARRLGRLAPMIGRERELALLRARWRRAQAGEAQVVLLTGEAGIGKSRILRALQDSIAAEPHVRIAYQCSPYHADSALYPIIYHLAHAAGFAPADSAETKLDRLEAFLGETVPGGAGQPALMAALLGIDARRRYGELGLTPQQQRLRTFEALIDQLHRIAQNQPVLWTLEDAHWVDPTTLEVLDMGVERLAEARILIVVTARPEFQHPIGGRDLTRLALGRLSRAEVAGVVRSVTRGKSLPEELMREIAARTDGVPLFVEEFTKSMLDSGAFQESGSAYVLDRPLEKLAIPETLQDSLMARLDRLQPVKEVAQVAACIGRDFDQDLLERVAPHRGEALRSALQRLVEAELIHRQSAIAEGRFAFKHALVRDAAYESLLKARRQEVHRKIAQALESSAEVPPEILAHHAAQAGLSEKAIFAWQKAGGLAISRPAFKEAIAHLTQALKLAEQMDHGREWQERRLLLMLMLGQASIPLRGYSHSQTVAIFRDAQELVREMPDAPHRFSIFYAVWVGYYVRGEHDRAHQTARAMVEEAERERNASHLLTATRSLAMSRVATGEPAAALEAFERAATLAGGAAPRSREQRIALADRFSTDPHIATQFHLGLTELSLGRIDRACALVAEALAGARELAHVHTLSHALAYSAIFAALCRDADRALALSSETIDFAGRHELEMWRGYGSAVQGMALWQKGDAAAAVRVLEKGFAALEKTHTGATMPLYRAFAACGFAALGRLEDAERHAAHVRDELASGSERYYWPECQRLLGVYLHQTPAANAAACADAFGRALELGRAQGTRLWQLYAALDLARLWSENGERARALDLLVPIAGGFTEGRESAPLREAAELMRTLR